MMVIPVRIKPSPIHGLGVFSVFPIKKGTVVWVYNSLVDERIPIPENLTEFQNKYGYISPGRNFLEVPGDATMFMNHSSNPNVSYLDGDVNKDIGHAIKYIDADTELVCNYAEFVDISRQKYLV